MERADERRDEALLAAIAEGDRGALRILYDRHSPWLLLRLSRRCSDPGLVDEVLQDTFVAVWRKPRAFSGRGEVGAWLWGIAIRRLVDGLRRAGVRERLVPRRRPSLEGLRPSRWAGAAPSAEEQVLLAVEHGDLAGALNRLSPELRAVVQATVLDGLTTQEAGRLLGIPAGTVKTRMMRARIQLREDLT